MITNSLSVNGSSHKRGFRVLTAVITVLFFCSVTFTAFATTNTQSKVTVTDGEKTVAVSNLFGVFGAFFKNASSVNVESDGESQNVIYSKGTVADAIDRAGITLNGNDIVLPSLDTKLDGLTNIRILRVKYKTISETVSVPFETETVPCDDMFIGEEEILIKGIEGEKQVFRTCKYVDGEYEETIFSKEKVVSEPVTEVKKVGTKQRVTLASFKNSDAPISDLNVPSDLKLDKNGIPVDYAYCVSGKATAYTGDPATASGRTPMPGHIAVDPKEFPYGTELYVVSADGSYVYGYCIAADTGGFVKMGNTDIDLYMDNEDMCCDWGNRNVKIYVLDR